MRHRVYLVGLFAAFVYAAISLRLFVIQVAHSRGLSLAAAKQRASSYPLEMARGHIRDRNGTALTDFRTMSLVAFPCAVEASRRAELAAAVSSVLGLDYGRVLGLLEGDAPVRLAEGLDRGQAEALKGVAHGGLAIVEESRRYSGASVARHVVGYVDAAGRGLAGIEKAFDSQLAGEYAAALTLCVDAAGRPVPGLGYRMAGSPPMDDRLDVVLTLDYRTQAVVERELESAVRASGTTRGAAAVVLDARTAEILAMASRPDFDQCNVGSYLGDERSPLLNRAVTAYPPGSVFKTVVAAAAVEEGEVGLGEQFECRGEIEVGGTVFRCSGGEGGRAGHGVLDFASAVAQSCNVTLIRVGQRVGAHALDRYARLLGYGSATGCGVGGESAGNLPDPGMVYPADLGNLSIGQWKAMATPLQVAQAMTAVVNEGEMQPVSLVKEVRRPSGEAVRVFRRAAPVRAFSGSTAAWLRRALQQATRFGTGSAAWVPGYGSAGKTGSAETGRKAGSGNVLHAWFVGYAPLRSPRYICSVLVEEGGYGGAVAAPVFRSIMEGLLR